VVQVRGTAAPPAARGAAAEGVVSSDGSGKMNGREKTIPVEGKKGRGKNDGPWARGGGWLVCSTGFLSPLRSF
jgi:hypothetical protein